MVYQYLIAAMVLIIPAVAGVAVLLRLNVLREKMSIFVVGSTLGITVYGTVTYALAYVTPISSVSVLIELALFLVIAFIALSKDGLRNILHAKTDRVALIIFCISLILFFIIGGKLLIEKPEGIYTGIINAYGDIGWHASIINGLAAQGTLPMENPIYGDERLTYPFLANLISTTMVVLGSSLAASVNVPAILLIPCILSLIYFLAKQYGQMREAGVLACILFLFGGATFGWIQFFSDITNTALPLSEFLLTLPAEDYSGVGTSTKGFHFLNPVTSLLLPQRTILFGIPIVLSVLLLIHPKNMKRRYAAAVAGILAGMLPLFHAHACIALAAAVIAMIIAFPHGKQWAIFFAGAFSIGLPELVFYAQGTAVSGSFLRYEPFWMAGTKNPIIYWIQNTGAYLLLSIGGLFLKAPKEAKALAMAGTALFLIANTFLFAPWAWDNFKLFVFWLIFILPLVTWMLATALKRHPSSLLQMSVIAFVCIHAFAGLLDVYKLAMPTARTWQEWDAGGVAIAREIRALVPASAPILTAPVHNSPAILSGRTLFLGYPAHIWSHGGSPWNRELEVKNYFSGTGETVATQKPQYILVGPQEMSLVPTLVVRPSWKALATHGAYTLYSNN